MGVAPGEPRGLQDVPLRCKLFLGAPHLCQHLAGNRRHTDARLLRASAPCVFPQEL